MNVVGVDLSTRTIDLVILNDDTNEARWVPVPIHDPRSTFEAARNVKTALAVAGVGSAVWDTVRLVGVEKPFSSSKATVYSYGLVVGALLACIPRGLEVGLPRPPHEGWARNIWDDGWVCEVDQFRYGHRANKRTWLYYIGEPPAMLAWGRRGRSRITVRNDGGGGRDQRSATPPEFRDVLLQMARTASRVAA